MKMEKQKKQEKNINDKSKNERAVFLIGYNDCTHS